MFVKVNALLQKELQKIMDNKQTEKIQEPTSFLEKKDKETYIEQKSNELQLSEQDNQQRIQYIQQKQYKKIISDNKQMFQDLIQQVQKLKTLNLKNELLYLKYGQENIVPLPKQLHEQNMVVAFYMKYPSEALKYVQQLPHIVTRITPLNYPGIPKECTGMDYDAEFIILSDGNVLKDFTALQKYLNNTITDTEVLNYILKPKIFCYSEDYIQESLIDTFGAIPFFIEDIRSKQQKNLRINLYQINDYLFTKEYLDICIKHNKENNLRAANYNYYFKTIDEYEFLQQFPTSVNTQRCQNIHTSIKPKILNQSLTIIYTIKNNRGALQQVVEIDRSKSLIQSQFVFDSFREVPCITNSYGTNLLSQEDVHYFKIQHRDQLVQKNKQNDQQTSDMQQDVDVSDSDSKDQQDNQKNFQKGRQLKNGQKYLLEVRTVVQSICQGTIYINDNQLCTIHKDCIVRLPLNNLQIDVLKLFGAIPHPVLIILFDQIKGSHWKDILSVLGSSNVPVLLLDQEVPDRELYNFVKTNINKFQIPDYVHPKKCFTILQNDGTKIEIQWWALEMLF
ncbi:Hypothetical_protein [Hexamita inflata]|uniref:Hypothetical_protein n=1 Tax=Hexamita inflata TaxID=28002 RepID=A0AA86NL91_9EUKA|nr:Hypothetical protein HINF_LOCUS8825 [Hexamita inflata]